MKPLFGMICGIDYGSKLAGTTVIAFLENNEVTLLQSEKKKSADAFILEQIKVLGPKLIALDAPLSLPGVYRGISDFSNYHYRKADAELKAMSPMFLGGLTARAMELKSQLNALGIEVLETYPKAQAAELELQDYKRSPDLLILHKIKIEKATGWRIPSPQNQHQLDAVLALVGAHRYARGTSKAIGDKAEGLIHF